MKIRYEQYTNIQGQPPFVLIDNIKRNSILSSKSYNWHENIEIQYCKEGQGYVLIDGKCYDFKQGDIAIVDSNSIHYTYTDTDMVYACIIVSTKFCTEMEIDHLHLAFTPLIQNERLTNVFDEICKTFKSDSKLRLARLNYLMLDLVMDIVKNHSIVKSGTNDDNKKSSAAKSVILFIQENYDKKITLDRISKEVLTDKYTLCKIFKRSTGQTIFENLNEYRCLKAAEYIAEGKSVSEAASLCGFDNNSFFTKTFKRYIGTLPSKITTLEYPVGSKHV